MGTSGVPIDIPKTKLIEAIKKNKGVISHICRELSCCYETAMKLINADPELIALLKTQRNAYDEEMLDLSETTMKDLVSQRKDLSNAFAAARFMLNTKGKNRGYAPQTSNTIVNIDGDLLDQVSSSKDLANDKSAERKDPPAVK